MSDLSYSAQREQRRRVPFELRMRLYKAIVVNMLLWGCESWAIQSKEVQALRVFQFRCLRAILKINIMHKISRLQFWNCAKHKTSSRPWIFVGRAGLRSYRTWTSPDVLAFSLAVGCTARWKMSKPCVLCLGPAPAAAAACTAAACWRLTA